MTPHFVDVLKFHEKFQLPTHEKVALHTLRKDIADYRVSFMNEESAEFIDGWHEGDLQKQLDALVDLVYVALGTAVMMGLTPEAWQCLWDSVQNANMNKVLAKDLEESLAKTGRGHPMDVVKPDGWVSPTARQLEIIDHELHRSLPA